MVSGTKSFLEITKEEYDEYAKAKDNLVHFFYIEEKYDLVVENYIELETTLLEIAARQMITRTFEYNEFQRYRNLIIRRMCNYLSLSRMYIDQTSHHISQIFKKRSKQYTQFIEEVSKQYDSYLGYRVMDALRNFMHRGYPIQGTSFPSKRREKDDDCEFLYTVEPFLNISELCEDKKIKASVLEELKNIGDKVHIKTMLREHFEALGKNSHVR